MHIQTLFDKTVLLLQTNSETLDIVECVEEMKCSEVLFSNAGKLEKSQFLKGHNKKSEFPAINNLKIPVERIVTLIDSFELSKGEGIYFVSITTEDKTYVVFTDDGLQILHGIVTSPLKFAQKEIHNQQNVLRGVPIDSFSFLNGVLQQ